MIKQLSADFSLANIKSTLNTVKTCQNLAIFFFKLIMLRNSIISFLEREILEYFVYLLYDL